jgi:DNA-directed RNA polymerase subunit RPC12/RpoP
MEIDQKVKDRIVMEYVSSVGSAAVPTVESWSEIRCPACVPLGWPSSRLLFKVNGVMSYSGARVEIVCHRCKSLVSWVIGVPVLHVIKYGQKNDRHQTAAFE